MLDAVRCLRLNFYQERVLLVRKLAEDSHRGIDDVLYIRGDLRCAHRNVRLAEDHAMMGSPRIELEDLEFSDECRRVDEDVVVGSLITVSFLFETRVYLPAAG